MKDYEAASKRERFATSLVVGILIAIAVLLGLQACPVYGQEIFADGFEIGDARHWSEVENTRPATIGIVLWWYAGAGPENEMIQVRWNDGTGWRDGHMRCPVNVYEYGCHSLYHPGGTYDVCVNVELIETSNGFMWLSLAEGCEA